MYTCREFAEISARETFLLAKYATVVVAVDSVFSHLAAAFQRPAVLLYGAFRPELLAAPYCDRPYVLQHDMPCGPCHQHHGRCTVEPEAYASPCMRAIEPEQVVQAVDRLLEGRRPRRRIRVRNRPGNIRGECPVCGSRSFELMARKGDTFYASCSLCSTVFRSYNTSATDLFAEQEPHAEMPGIAETVLPPDEAIAHTCSTVGALLDGTHPRVCLLVGTSQNAGLFKLLRRCDWECHAYDPMRGILAGGAGSNTHLYEGRTAGEDLTNNRRYAAAFLMGEVTRIPEMQRLWALFRETVTEGGIVAILSPVAEHCMRKEALPLNTRKAGRNIVIPSVKGLNMTHR